jgi:hypothetical protein
MSSPVTCQAHHCLLFAALHIVGPSANQVSSPPAQKLIVARSAIDDIVAIARMKFIITGSTRYVVVANVAVSRGRPHHRRHSVVAAPP